MTFVSHLQALLKANGFDHFGWAPLERPLSMAVYQEWIARGHHASMEYLAAHLPLKAEPSRFVPRAISAIVVGKSYLPHPYGPAPKLLSARTALYARGEDYHRGFKAELERVATALRLDFTRDEFLCFTDSAPILERDLAARAGLGWVGKNTCLIHPKKGSLFFIGEILTSKSLDESAPTPIADACGTCDRCLVACPTGALESPRWLNANKCISYWTIEARDPAPTELRSKFGDWFFGCDICQTVCPWNEKSFGRAAIAQIAKAQPEPQILLADLRWILASTHRALARAFKTSAMSRARPLGLKRNALVVIANLRLRELRPEVELARAQPNLKEVADWTHAQLNLLD